MFAPSNNSPNKTPCNEHPVSIELWAEEYLASLSMISATIFFAVLTVHDKFSVVYYTTALLAINTALFIRRLEHCLALIGTILMLLHVVVVYITMVASTVHPLVLGAVVALAAISITPVMILRIRPLHPLVCLVPLAAGLGLLGIWVWMSKERKFDTYYLDLICMLASVCLLSFHGLLSIHKA